MAEPVQPAAQLTADYEVRGDAVVVRFDGEVDLAVASAFWTYLANGLDAASAASAPLMVIDLSAVAFFGSNGLSDLVRCQAEGASNGVAIKLSSSSSIVNRVLRATALDEILQVYPAVEDALRAGDGVDAF